MNVEGRGNLVAVKTAMAVGQENCNDILESNWLQQDLLIAAKIKNAKQFCNDPKHPFDGDPHCRKFGVKLLLVFSEVNPLEGTHQSIS